MNKEDILNIFENAGYSSNRWLIRYVNFIYIFKLDKSIKCKTEKHHILPTSIFKEYSNFKLYKWNQAILSNRAHIIAHYMLAKAVGGKMWCPLYFYVQRYNFNSKILAEIYENNKKVITEINKGMIGVIDITTNELKMVNKEEFNNNDNLVGWNKGKKEIGKKISISLSRIEENGKTVAQNRGANMIGEKNPMFGNNGEKNHFYGKKHSDETKKKISEKNKGRIMSNEQKIKISKTLKGTKKDNTDGYKKYNYYIICDDKKIFQAEDQRDIQKFLIKNNFPSLYALKKRDILNFKFRKELKS